MLSIINESEIPALYFFFHLVVFLQVCLVLIQNAVLARRRGYHVDQCLHGSTHDELNPFYWDINLTALWITWSKTGFGLSSLWIQCRSCIYLFFGGLMTLLWTGSCSWSAFQSDFHITSLPFSSCSPVHNQVSFEKVLSQWNLKLKFTCGF